MKEDEKKNFILRKRQKKKRFQMGGLLLAILLLIFVVSGCGNVKNMIVSMNKELAVPEISTVTNFDGSSQVTIINPNEDGTVYYTLDGAEPLTNSIMYVDSFNITQTTTLKARVITEDVMSEVVTQQFTITEKVVEGSGNNSTNSGINNDQVTQPIQSATEIPIQNLGVAVNSLFDVGASSVLNPMGGFSYSEWNLIDYDWSTAWVEGVAGNGIGENVSFTYLGSDMVQIQGVEIVNGYAKSNQSFYENGCVTQLDMYVNGTYNQTIYLSPVASAQYFNFYFTVMYGDVITFVIEGVQEGPYDGEYDTAITEITFY